MATIPYTNFEKMLDMGSSSFLSQANSVSACKNCYMYKRGVIKKVPGYQKEDLNQFNSSYPVTFLHYYYDPANFAKYLICGSKTSSTAYTLKYLTYLGTTTSSGFQSFTNSTDYNENAVLSGVNYLGKTFIVGYAGNSEAYINVISMTTINGTTMAKSATDDSDLDGAPHGRYIVRYRDLLYVLDATDGSTHYPNRVYFCDEPTAGSISWDNSVNFLNVGQDDGDEINGGIDALDRLVIFKHNSMWIYDESQLQKIADIGCVEHRTIVKINNLPYWYDGNSIYTWRGGAPINISERIQPFLDNVDKSVFENRLTRPTKIFAVKYNNEYRLFVGDVTYRGYTYTNTWICYDTVKDIFYLRCTKHTPYSACFLLDSDNVGYTDFGSEEGWVYFFANPGDGVYSDASSEIDSFLETQDLDYGSPEIKKFNTKAIFYVKNPNGMKVQIATDKKDYYTRFSTILKNNIEERTIDQSGNFFRFRFAEKSDQQPWEFNGLTIKSQIIEDYE